MTGQVYYYDFVVDEVCLFHCVQNNSNRSFASPTVYNTNFLIIVSQTVSDVY